MKTSFPFLCLICFVLLFLCGCGGGSLSPAEKAKADKFLAEYGRNVIGCYLDEVRMDQDTDGNIIINHLKYFMSKGADINGRNEFDGVAIHSAAENGNVEVVKFLVSNGADVNAKSKRDRTPLHDAAVDKKNVEVIKFLVSKGADVNVKIPNYVDMTILHVVIEEWGQENLEIVKFLVSNGSDINAKDSQGQTPHDLAKRYGYKEVAEYLTSMGAKSGRELE